MTIFEESIHGKDLSGYTNNQLNGSLGQRLRNCRDCDAEDSCQCCNIGVRNIRRELFGRGQYIPRAYEVENYRSKLIAPKETELAYVSKEKARNALGTILSSDVDKIRRQLETILRSLNIPFYFEEKQQILRLVFKNCEHIRLVCQRTNSPEPTLVSLFFYDIYQMDGTKDSSRKMVWINFLIKKQTLTRFKKWLLDNIFEVDRKDDC